MYRLFQISVQELGASVRQVMTTLAYIQYSPCGVSEFPRHLDSDFCIIPPRAILPSGEAGPEI